MSEKPENDGTFLLGGCRLQLKGNVHCHTDYSDGALSPEEAIRAYRETGYDFLFLTEHCDKLPRGKPPDSASFDSPGFRVLSGLEYRCTANNGSKENLHILGLGTQDRSFWKPGQDMQETVDAINKASGIAIVAHPHWSGLTSADLVDLRGVHGIEIFNSVSDSCNSKGYAVTIWEELLNSDVRVCALAVDDTHYYNRFSANHVSVNYRPDFALGWIVLDVQSRTPSDIIEAIRSGRFYSSCGPEIHEWKLRGYEMTFRCSEVKTITLSSAGPLGHVFRDSEGGTLCSAHINLEECNAIEEWPFLRFSCCDANGRWAWTNPFFCNPAVWPRATHR